MQKKVITNFLVLLRKGRNYLILFAGMSGALALYVGLSWPLNERRADIDLRVGSELQPLRSARQGASQLFGHYYRYAYNEYKQQRFKEALAYLGEASAERLSARQQYQYYLLSGAVFWQLEAYERALAFLKRAHQLEATVFTHLFLGMLYEVLNNEELCILHYTQAGKLDKTGHPQGSEKLGDYYFKRGRYLEALAVYKQLAVLQLPNIMMKLSLVHFYLADIPATLAQLEKLSLAERTRHLDYVYFIQALSHISQHDYQRAAPYFEKAVAVTVRERRHHYLYYWAQSALNHGHIDKAIELYQETLSALSTAEPHFYQALLALGNAYLLKGGYAESRLLFKRYLAERGDNVSVDTRDVRYYLALADFHLGHTDDALTGLVALTTSYDLSARMLRSVDYLKARSQLEAGNYFAAQAQLKYFIDNWGSYPEAVYRLLELEITLNRKSFLEKYREFTAEYAEDDNFRLILAKYFETLGDYPTVISLLKRYQKATPLLNKKLADLYLKSKEYDVALEYYNRAALRTGDIAHLAELYNNQAFAYAQLGNVLKAQQLLMEAMPNHRRKVPFLYNLALVAKQLQDDGQYQEQLYRARLESEDEQDTTLQAMVYFHSSLAAVQNYRLTHARTYLNMAYELAPDNPKIQTLKHENLLYLFK